MRNFHHHTNYSRLQSTTRNDLHAQQFDTTITPDHPKKIMSASQLRQSDLGLPANSYIYKIISTASRQDALTYSRTDQLAAIASDDSLRFFDPATLEVQPNGIIKNVNEKVTCLERGNDLPSNLVATAGRDGLIRFWDKRNPGRAIAEIQSRG